MNKDKNIKIAIIKEGKVPQDKRTALTPQQAKYVQDHFENVQVCVQSCNYRCYADQEYKDMGIEVKTDIQDCNLFLGIKEVPIHQLLANKTYMFFSHTIKKQQHNRKLLQAVLHKNISLVDYECLTYIDGRRILGFGSFAGIAGTYNALRCYGLKNNLFELPPPENCHNYLELKEELKKVKLPAVKIAYTGGGRVASGVKEILSLLEMKQVDPVDFIANDFDVPVFTQLLEKDYNRTKNGSAWVTGQFYAHPAAYMSTFPQYIPVTDILIHSAFWNPEAPVFFTSQDMAKDDFNIQVIADISCDLNGPIPSTLKATTIADPVYGYNKLSGEIVPPYRKGYLDVMSVDNLPCSLPRDSSEAFGEDIVEKIIPALLGKDPQEIVARATIAEHGELTPHFEYLSDYILGGQDEFSVNSAKG